MDQQKEIDRDVYERYGLKPGVVYCGNKAFDLRKDGVKSIAAAINAMIREQEQKHGGKK